MSTNIQSIIDFILKLAVDNNTNEEDMTAKIFIALQSQITARQASKFLTICTWLPDTRSQYLSFGMIRHHQISKLQKTKRENFFSHIFKDLVNKIEFVLFVKFGVTTSATRLYSYYFVSIVQ